MQRIDSTVLEIHLPPFVQREEARLLLAAKLFETGRLSIGQAAELARMTRRGFLEMLGDMGVPVINYPAEELADELKW